ncbi:MAG: acyl-CoA dehydrogenase family protein [Anaerolineae bacterium]
MDAATLEWQRKTREFVEQELIPFEVEAEMNGGRLPAELSKQHKQRALELGFPAMDAPPEYGGLALRNVEQVAVWEQLGRVTNALCWCFSEAQAWMFEAFTEDQLQRYALPMMRGERKECYAITEAESGSDVVVETSAERVRGGYLLNGEKWFVTSFNLADFLFVQAKLSGGSHAGQDILLLVDVDSEGLEETRRPLFSHTFDHHHSELRFDSVFVPEENLLGAEGDGMAFAHAWFRRERLMIAARNCGASARLIEEATEFAKNRQVSGETLFDKQMVQAMLADSVAELWAARLMTYETAAAHDRGEDVKALHARCSVAKLYASEAAGRIADRCQQIFGGRGYMRENCAERFVRELRVDRIWEGASEVQRLIIARQLGKRGLDGI